MKRLDTNARMFWLAWTLLILLGVLDLQLGNSGGWGTLIGAGFVLVMWFYF